MPGRRWGCRSSGLSRCTRRSRAVAQRPHLVSHWLGEAGQLAGRLPDDIAGSWQSFCQSNVGIWRVAIGVERGDSGGKVLELAAAVREEKLASRSRKAQFLTDVGRGLAREPGTQAEAVRWLRRAEAGPAPSTSATARPLARASRIC